VYRYRVVCPSGASQQHKDKLTVLKDHKLYIRVLDVHLCQTAIREGVDELPGPSDSSHSPHVELTSGV
jgi:hypothetical protein